MISSFFKPIAKRHDPYNITEQSNTKSVASLKREESLAFISSRKLTSNSTATTVTTTTSAAAPAMSRTAGGDDFARNDQYRLGKENAHPRDKRVSMKESTHTYVIDGSSKNLTSVTTMLHNYFSHFDAIAQSERIAARPFKKQEYRGLSALEIRKMWQVNADQQSGLGTQLHAQLEQYYNDLPVNSDVKATVEWAQFEDFHQREILSRGWVMYHPEWIIFNEELRLCGSMDAPFAVSTNNHSEIIIIDWKRTKDIDNGPFTKGATGIGPCRDISDCKIGHYGVQLNVYKWMLEREYQVKVIGMYLAVFHPGQEREPLTPLQIGSDGKPANYRFIHIEPNPTMVDEIMQERRLAVHKMTADDESERLRIVSAIPTAKRILVCGDRKYTNVDAIRQQLLVFSDRCNEVEIIHGDSVGASQFVRDIVAEMNWPTNKITVLSGLGSRLDHDVLESHRPELVLAFHDRLWNSKATKHMVGVARQSGVPVRVIGNE